MAKSLALLAAKPQLVSVTLDSPEILEKHGDSFVFYTWDRQPLDVFMQLASADSSESVELVNILRKLILDENGKEIIVGDVMLPTDLLVAAMQEITSALGK